MGGQAANSVTTPGAVFLSYASEDSAVAERIATALRAAGIEVWFDKSELRGGDAWDRQIREQIHDCRLFIPVISANSERREEGYFRREWSRAADRTRDMAHKRTFLVPVVIDGTTERGASVPEKFHEIQWTRLSGGDTPPAFVERVRRLLSPVVAPQPAPAVGTRGSVGGPTLASARSARGALPALIWGLTAVCVVAIVMYYASQWSAVSHRGETPPMAAAAPATGSIPDKSIAVLPFVDLSEKHDQEYFGDGMAEEILDLLVKIPGLRVMGRTSSFSFKGKQTDLPSIGKALGVAYIVEGSVRRAGDRIRVTAQLVDARDGSHHWSHTFDGTASDMLRLQQEIATQVARSLDVEMVEMSTRLPPGAAIKSSEAHDYYLRGLQELYQESTESINPAREYFQKALLLAPGFAPAAVAIAEADSYKCLDGLQPNDTCPRALASVDAALNLDPRSADAYAIRAQVLMGYQWDWPGAKAAIDKGTELGGGPPIEFAAARLAYSIGDMTRGRQILQRIIASDPLEPNAMIDMGVFVELRSGRFDEAESWVRRGLQISPKYSSGQYFLGLTLLMQGKLQAALAAMKEEKIDEGQLSGLILVYIAMDRQTDAEAALNALRKNNSYFPSDFARAYAFRGDAERAMSYLEKGYQTHDPALWYIRGDPLFGKIERDPRYKAFLRKMNLPD